MKIDLPEILPLHISTRGSHTYETAMENREGSHAAMTKAWAVMRDLLIADDRVRARVVEMHHVRSKKP